MSTPADQPTPPLTPHATPAAQAVPPAVQPVPGVAASGEAPKAVPPGMDPATLERQRRTTQAILREAAMRLHESATLDLYTALGMIDPRDIQADFWGTAYPSQFPSYFYQNRKRGEFIPVYTDEVQLRIMRDRNRRICAENEFAICALKNRQNYTVGKGLQYRATKRVPDCPDRLLHGTQKILDAFAECNDLWEIESETQGRLDRDGEAILRTFELDNGLLTLRFVESELLRSPVGDSYGPDHSFGVWTERRDVESVKGYWIIENPTENPTPSLVDACEVIHFKQTPPGIGRGAKRGVPLFYPVEKNFRRIDGLLTSMSSMATARAKIALIRRFDGIPPQAAQQAIQNLTAITATDPGTGEILNLEQLRPGTVLNSSKNIEYDMPSGDVDIAGFVGVLQADLRAIAAMLVMPEWMLTVDASGANYASSLVAEAPSTKNFERMQHYLKRRFGESRYEKRESLAWRQIRVAVRRGVLPREVYRLVDIQVEGPSLVVRDRRQEAEVNKIYMGLGLLSPQHVSQEQGWDYDQEQRNREQAGLPTIKELAARQQQQPGGQPGGGMGGTGEQPPGSGPDNGGGGPLGPLDMGGGGAAGEQRPGGPGGPQHTESVRQGMRETAGPHKFSSTQFNLADAGYSRSQGSPVPLLRKLAKSIPAGELAPDGKEDTYHVTAKYGLHTDDADEVRRVVAHFGPVIVRLGKTSLFQNPDADVLKVDVYGADLHRLNTLLCDSLQHTDKYGEYRPHITIAYLKPGMGGKYAGNPLVDGMEVSCSELIFSDQAGRKTVIPLVVTGRPEEELAGMRESEDAQHHEHGKDGKFVSKGQGDGSGGSDDSGNSKGDDAGASDNTKSNKPTLSDRREAHNLAHEAFAYSGELEAIKQAPEHLQDIPDLIEAGGGADDARKAVSEAASAYHDYFSQVSAHLGNAGATDKELAKLSKATDKIDTVLTRKGEAVAALADKVKDAKNKVEELEAAEPEEPDQHSFYGDEPHQDDFSSESEWQAAHDKWQDAGDDAYNAAAEKYDKARDKWEAALDKAREKHDAAVDAMQGKLDDLAGDLDEAYTAADGVASELLEEVGGRLDEEEEQEEQEGEKSKTKESRRCQRYPLPMREDATGGGFTGQRKDSVGRTRCYSQGKEVPCPKKGGTGQPGAGKGGSGTSGKGGDTASGGTAHTGTSHTEKAGWWPSHPKPTRTQLKKAKREWNNASVAGKAKIIARKAIQAGKNVEHGIAHVVEKGLAKLPGPAQKAVKGAWKVAFLSYGVFQEGAKEVCRQAGLSEAHTAKVAGVLAAADILLAKPAVLACELLHVGSLATVAAGAVPIASALYLGYSVARRPVATLKAARNVVGIVGRALFGEKKAAAGVAGGAAGAHESIGHDTALRALARRLAACTDDVQADWYLCLVSNALDRTSDLDRAVRIAGEALEKYPTQPDEAKEAKESKDASGHEHGNDGKFTGNGGGGSSGSGHGSAHDGKTDNNPGGTELKKAETAKPDEKPAAEIKADLVKDRRAGVEIKPKMNRQEGIDLLNKLSRPGWKEAQPPKDSHASPSIEMEGGMFRVALSPQVAVSDEEQAIAGKFKNKKGQEFDSPVYMTPKASLAVNDNGAMKHVGYFNTPAGAMIEAELRFKVMHDQGRLGNLEITPTMRAMIDRVSEPMKALVEEGTPPDKILPNGKKVPDGYVKCAKCDGFGVLYEYGHVASGVCFKCSGNGLNKSKGKKAKETTEAVPATVHEDTVDASGHKHAADGKFGSGGGGTSKAHDKAGDAAHDKAHDAAGKAHDATHAAPHPVAAALHKHIDAQKHLSPEQKTAYRAAVSRVVHAMPEKARRHLAADLKAVDWHADAQSLTDALRTDGIKIPAGQVAQGAYYHNSGKARLDGMEVKTRSPGLGGDQTNIHGAYAHELGHVVDRKYRYSSEPEWKQAYQKEIVGDITAGAPLTAYARRAGLPHEGFAEFARAVYGSDVPLGETEKRFPKCARFFKDNGLWPEGGPSQNAKTTEAEHHGSNHDQDHDGTGNGGQLLPDLFTGGSSEGGVSVDWVDAGEDDNNDAAPISETKDDKGHEHGSDGKFTGKGGGGTAGTADAGKSKPAGNNKDKSGGKSGKAKGSGNAVKPAGSAKAGKPAAGNPAIAAKPAKPRVPEQQPLSDKAARAKAAHKLVDKSVQRYAEEYNEPRMARVVGGESFPDSEPIDIAIPADSKDRERWRKESERYAAEKAGGKKPVPMDLSGNAAHGIELKTMVDNGNGKLTMDSYAQVRKIVWEAEKKAVFHTIVSDDQHVFNANGDGKHDDSKRRYFYRRGVAGSARVSGMYECKDEDELKSLMSMPEDQLPPAARRTDEKLREGKWEFFQDEQGKGYRNNKTGQEFRAKK